MPRKYFDRQKNRLIFEGDSPDSENWDKGWSRFDMKSYIENSKNERFVSGTTKQYIQADKSKKILEGGCGLGNFVYSLDYNGYDTYGIDFAERTVKKVNEMFPKLKITIGDVRKLDFADNYFDGYWSLGVIEHFYEGYGDILKEMTRITRKGGYLFVTFPYMSPLRKIKAKLGLYERFDENTFDKSRFYQFALNPSRVISDFEKSGFTLIKEKPLTGLKGMKDEVAFLERPLQYIYDGKSFIFKVVGYAISLMLSRFSGHAVLLVFRKK